MLKLETKIKFIKIILVVLLKYICNPHINCYLNRYFEDDASIDVSA